MAEVTITIRDVGPNGIEFSIDGLGGKGDRTLAQVFGETLLADLAPMIYGGRRPKNNLSPTSDKTA